MKGVYYLGVKQLELREVDLPQPGKGELLIRNHACGVCGTDVHIYHGEPGSATVTPPVVLGHEFSGEVVAVGPGVSGFAVGERVTVDPNIYCGVCRWCRAGKKQMCENMGAVGVNQDGGFAEYCLLPASQALSIGQLGWEEGAMVEPLACCVHGIDRAGIRPGDRVLVIGGGAIGLMMVQLARLSGAAFVALSEPVAMRREVALSLGADAAFDPLSVDPAAEFNRLSGVEGADVVIECVGRPAAAETAIACVTKGGTVLLFSVPPVDGTIPLPLFDVFKKELTIVGSFVNPDTHSRAAALLMQGKINIAPLITHRFGLDGVEQAILAQQGAESIKVLVIP